MWAMGNSIIAAMDVAGNLIDNRTQLFNFRGCAKRAVGWVENHFILFMNNVIVISTK